MSGFIGKEVSEWIKETRAKAPGWFNLAENVSEFCQSLLLGLQPHQNNGQEVLGAILFKRILCAFQAIIILEERGMYTEASIQRRGMLEALFVLGAIWQQPELITDYVKNDLHRRRDIYKNIKLSSSKNREILSEWLSGEELDKNIEELTELTKGVRYLSVKAFAQAAKLYDLYLTDYSVLSEAAHHVGKDLERSLHVGSSDNIEALVWGPEPNDPFQILYPAIDQMLMATEPISKIFNLDIKDKVEAFGRESSKLGENQK